MADRFEVLDQQHTMAKLPDGTFGDVIRVKYRAKDSDVIGSVDVPVTSYNADTVAAAILQRVDNHDAVANL